jgi:hypothetical protein
MDKVKPPRPIHNTNSPNFVKLDYTDICNCIVALENLEGDITNNEYVTLERCKLIRKFAEEKKEREANGTR